MSAAAHSPSLVIGSRELCQILGISRRTLGNWIAAGKVLDSCEEAGCKHRWRREEVMRWIAAGMPPRAAWRAQNRMTKHRI